MTLPISLRSSENIVALSASQPSCLLMGHQSSPPHSCSSSARSGASLRGCPLPTTRPATIAPAEVGVKSAKRLIRDNIHADGSLDNDRFARAILTHRNNPCPTSGLSPAQIVYGRVLRDFIQLQPGKFSPRPEWRLAAEQRAAAFAKRHLLKHEQLQQGTKQLPPLILGDHVSRGRQSCINFFYFPAQHISDYLPARAINMHVFKF